MAAANAVTKANPMMKHGVTSKPVAVLQVSDNPAESESMLAQRRKREYAIGEPAWPAPAGNACKGGNVVRSSGNRLEQELSNRKVLRD
jgi:hypothetical protein